MTAPRLVRAALLRGVLVALILPAHPPARAAVNTPLPTRTKRTTFTAAPAVLTETPTPTSTPTPTATPAPTGTFVEARIKPELIEWPTPNPDATPKCVLVLGATVGQDVLHCVSGSVGGGGGADSVFAITLSPGLSTTVTHADVTMGSRIRCGCEVDQTASVVCNTHAAWMVRLPSGPIVVHAGSFTIPHSHALGNEVVPCVVM
jgi:hypothetical protein